MVAMNGAAYCTALLQGKHCDVSACLPAVVLAFCVCLPAVSLVPIYHGGGGLLPRQKVASDGDV